MPLVSNPEDFHDLLWSFAGQRVVTVAARLGILRLLAQGPQSPEAVARTLQLDGLATGKIVRTLHALGLVNGRDGAYQVRDSLREMLQPGARDFTPFIEHAHELYDRWGETLESWVRTGQTPSRERTPEQARAFHDAMLANARSLAPKVLAAMPPIEPRRVLDVGGGLGGYAVAICQAYAQARVRVLDAPMVAQLGPAAVEPFGVGDRIEFVVGDYNRDDFGSGYDLVLLANVLHQELAARAQQMVSRSAAALAPGGMLAVVDFAVDDEKRAALMGCLFAINMRSFGDTYTAPTIEGWMREAGLTLVGRAGIEPAHWLITARAAKA